MTNPTHIRPVRTLAGGALAALLCVVASSPSAGQATGKTETLRFFAKPVSFTYTTADGSVSHRPPAGPPQAGDVLEVDSLDYAGDHRRHAKRPKASDYVRCAFNGGPEPDCMGVAAIGGSLLRFHGMELIGGTGRYQGATGKVVLSEEVEGGSDVVIKLKLR